MTVQQLLRLYPRAWRERYGSEFAELVGNRQLTMQQTVDIAVGAIDAWTSSSVRANVRGAAAGSKSKGDVMIQQLKAKVCATATPRYTIRDGLIGAGVMLSATFVLSAIGIWASRSGHHDLGQALKPISFPISMTLSMPFWLMKGQSTRAKAVIVGGTTLVLLAIGILSTKI